MPFKALLLGGLLILGMSGLAFAAVQEASDAISPPVETVVITEPSASAPSSPSADATDDDDDTDATDDGEKDDDENDPEDSNDDGVEDNDDDD